jgi:predicted metalloprotease
MEWRGRRGSRNIEDRRGMGGGRSAGIGGAGVVVLLLLGLFFGVDVTPLLQGQGPAGAPREITAEDQAAREFVSVTLADTEEVWANVFRDQLNIPYTPPILVLFDGATQSPCGGANGATGPFYCPLDRKVYLDTAFFTTLERRPGAGGDFAAAYVVAHEVGHHVQDELGILDQTNTLRRQLSEAQGNEISVRVELQADCLAGIWARQASDTFGSVESGDFEEALLATRQIGDDTLQRNAGQRPMPHTFTYGTSEQRQRWFATGLQSGQIADCDTF